MSYLERYLNGEYEQVWAELLALGGAIRQEPLYSAALAVTRETMRRIRHNLELLLEKLADLDYKFSYPGNLYLLDEEVLTQLAEFEQEIGLLPLTLRVFYEVVGSVDLIGAHPKLGIRIDDYPESKSFAIDVLPDPIAIYNPIRIDEYDEGLEAFENPYYRKGAVQPEKAKPYVVDISGDAIMKAGYSGGIYSIGLPEAAIDGFVIGYGTYFVE